MGDQVKWGEDCDFDEEHIWDVVLEKKDTSPKARKAKESSLSSFPRKLPTPLRMIPRSQNGNSEMARVIQQSVPVNIPDWSKIYRKNGGHNHGYGDGKNEEEGEENEDDDGWIPPHEWIAKRLSRNQISSFSVCEGAGRTLKGRDLSKVRNAVLTKTGFLE